MQLPEIKTKEILAHLKKILSNIIKMQLQIRMYLPHTFTHILYTI